MTDTNKWIEIKSRRKMKLDREEEAFYDELFYCFSDSSFSCHFNFLGKVKGLKAVRELAYSNLWFHAYCPNKSVIFELTNGIVVCKYKKNMVKLERRYVDKEYLTIYNEWLQNKNIEEKNKKNLKNFHIFKNHHDRLVLGNDSLKFICGDISDVREYIKYLIVRNLSDSKELEFVDTEYHAFVCIDCNAYNFAVINGEFIQTFIEQPSQKYIETAATNGIITILDNIDYFD